MGHALRLSWKPLDFLAAMPAHGDVVELRLGSTPNYMVCHPDLVHRVLVDDTTFDKGGVLFDSARAVFGNGIVACPRQDHRRQRRLLQPAFHRDRFPAYAQVMSRQIGLILDGWHEGRVLDVPAQMGALVGRIVISTLFTGDSDEVRFTVETSLDDVVRGIYREMFAPLALLSKLPTPGNRRAQRARARIRSAVADYVEDFRRDEADRGDLLSALLAARDDEGRPLDDAEIHDQVVNLIVAAFETTAALLVSVLRLLALHPEVLERLRGEVDGVLGGRIAHWADVPRLDLTRRVLTEAQRLYPPGWFVTRVATVDTELGGCRIPAGSSVSYSPYMIHRRADLYPDPSRFDPDRWLPGPAAERARTAYVAFGGGARKCLGDAFGMAEAVLILASIVSRWDLRAVGRIPDPKARISLGPLSLSMRAYRRTWNDAVEPGTDAVPRTSDESTGTDERAVVTVPPALSDVPERAAAENHCPVTGTTHSSVGEEAA